MTVFRPCIDLHKGRVKQIVGGSLRDDDADAAQENHVSEHGPEWFADRYRTDDLRGGHVIMLGAGNADAARAALTAYPGGLQIGGGIDASNGAEWLKAGASHVIVTSHLFENGELSMPRVEAMRDAVGAERLVIDLSCKRVNDAYFVATNRWQTITHTQLDRALLERLAPYCAEFLVHAVDVEGLCRGIESDVVSLLGENCPLPATYAGGGRTLGDLDSVAGLSAGRVDLTFGSALDLFGGEGVRYYDCVRYNENVTKG